MPLTCCTSTQQLLPEFLCSDGQGEFHLSAESFSTWREKPSSCFRVLCFQTATLLSHGRPSATVVKISALALQDIHKLSLRGTQASWQQTHASSHAFFAPDEHLPGSAIPWIDEFWAKKSCYLLATSSTACKLQLWSNSPFWVTGWPKRSSVQHQCPSFLGRQPRFVAQRTHHVESTNTHWQFIQHMSSAMLAWTNLESRKRTLESALNDVAHKWPHPTTRSKPKKFCPPSLCSDRRHIWGLFCHGRRP